MAETLQFDLVSPERRLASVQATEVKIPAAEGDMTAMVGHAPTITTLRPGVLQVVHSNGTNDYMISGGFAEIGGDSISVLAERALPTAEVTQDIFNVWIAEYRALHEKALENFNNEPGPVDDAARLLADMVAAGGHIGLVSDR